MSATRPITYNFIFILATLLFSGCGTTSIIGEIVTPPEMLAKIQPMRTLRVLVVYDDPSDLERIAKTISEASLVHEKQIGVELKTVPFPMHIVWEKGHHLSMLDQLSKATMHREAEFDLAVGFNSRVVCNFKQWWAVIDGHRRFVVIQKFHPLPLAHEVGHAFISSHSHSSAGLMRGWFPSFPGVEDYTFTKEDREEALRNKWRKSGDPIIFYGNDSIWDNCER